MAAARRKQVASGMRPMSQRRGAPLVRRARGFTLIELLVAISVMALLALMSWQGLEGMSRAHAQNRERGDAVLTLQTALSQWAADLDAAIPLAQVRPIDWDGRVLRITRRSTDTALPVVYVVAWTLRITTTGSVWQRWQSPGLDSRLQWQQAWDRAAAWAQDANPGNELRGAEVALMPIEAWQISYFRNGNWGPPNDGTSSGGSVELPDGIRLVLGLPQGSALAGLLTRDWIKPAATVPKT
ncbi:General secretion pathway protein J [Burkholderiales bacterium 8X]|nr:General secretion pathway protein J [Burkholderiales bacterium 8X]